MPTLSTNDIIQINNYLNSVKDTLQIWSEPGSRFYELDAYSFLGGFLPCGRVPKADDEIFSANQRIEDLNKALGILANAGADAAPPDTSVQDNCAALVAAINALNAKLDITTSINNAFNAFIPTLIARLDPSFNKISAAIDTSTNTIISSQNEIKVAINDTRIELKEARERLIVIQGENRGVEILERINDTRIELREARERLIRVEDCVCPPVEPVSPIDVDAFIARLMVEINAALEKNAILIFDSLYDQFVNLLGALEGRLNLKIDSPAWLTGVNAKLDLIIELLKKLDDILAFLKDLDLYLRTNIDLIGRRISALVDIANNIDANVSSVYLGLNLLRSIVNQLDNTVDGIRTTVNQLNNITNNIYNQVQNINNQNSNDNSQVLFMLGQIMSLLNSLSSDIDRLQPPSIDGSTLSTGCLTSQSFSFGGTGFLGISSQITSLANTVNALHSELCNTINNNDEVLNGELVTIDCTNSDNLIRVPFSGRGLKAITAGLEVNSNNIVKLHQEVCKQKAEEPNCFVVVPSDVEEELNIPRQLIIYWRVDNDEKIETVSKWDCSIALPISNLSWDANFANLRWVRGNISGRWYLKNSTSRLGGYFNTRQDAINTLNQLIQLTTLEPKTPEPRITTGGSSFIQSTGVITRPFKAVIVEKQGNKMVPVICYRPNN